MLRALLSLEARITSSEGAKPWARLISSSIPSSLLSSLPPPPPPPPSSSPPHSSLFDRLGDVLTPEIVAGSLATKGYAVVDGALDADTCRLLRAEIDSLKGAGLLRPNATFLVKGGGSSGGSGSGESAGIPPPPSSLSSATLLEKRGIWETDTWGGSAVSARAPLLSLAGREGARSLAALLSVLCPERFSLSGPAILKAQLNDGLDRGGEGPLGGGGEGAGGRAEGGGGGGGERASPSFPCFPLHFDSDESVDGRRVTAIFYLSEKAQSAEEEKDAAPGGELLLWPDLFRRRSRGKKPSSGSPSTSSESPLLPLAVAPRAGRLVLFSACGMPHAVSPSRRRRHCFTVWLSEGDERRGRRAERGEKEKEEGEARRGGGNDARKRRRRILSSQSGRRAAARVLLSPAWRRSLVAAHPPGPALDAALETHDRDTRKLAEALERARVVVEVVGKDGERRWELAESESESDDSDDENDNSLWF